MPHLTRWIAAALILILSLAQQGCSTTAVEPTLPPAGVIVGHVKFEGVPPKRRTIDTSDDAAIATARCGRPLLDNKLIVAPDGSLADAFVYVSAGLPSAPPPQNVKPAMFEYIGSELLPHVQGVLVNQPIQFANRDETLHSIHCRTHLGIDADFDVLQPAADKSKSHVFRRPEFNISIRCDVHPWDSAILHADQRITPDTPTQKITIPKTHGITTAFTYRMQPR